jgi:diguanylate cyclase (GGDEF)-like protein
MNTRDIAQSEVRKLRREVIYLRRMSEFAIGHMLKVDLQAIAMRQELEQKRRGFSLMAELAVTLGQELDNEEFLESISRRLNNALNMRRTVILQPEPGGLFVPSVLHGYSWSERQALENLRLEVDPEFFNPLTPILITGADPPARLAGLREALKLPFLISVPLLLRDEIVALLVTGRLNEQRPISPRLGWSDVETMRTVSAYLATLVAGHRLSKVEALANLDPLTNLPNFRKTKESLRQTLELAKLGGFKMAVLFIDLDDFKDVNDTYGHAVGDAVLYAVADRLRASVRESDLVGRLGGDEFVAVLTNLIHQEDAGLVAGKIIERLSEPIRFHGASHRIGVSIGISLFPDHAAEESLLLAAADEAMYLVKKRGKNAFLFAGSTENEK